MRILLAEDEPRVADAIASFLRRRGSAVDVAGGRRALDCARVHLYDVVVLDRDLRTVPADLVCRALHAEQPRTRILMLAASRAVEDVVAGLGLGADDYLGKPFCFAELAARVEALGRRAVSARPAVLRRRGVELDAARCTARRAGRDIELSPKELGVLRELLAADGAVVSAEDLLERVWDENTDPFTNTVRMTVMKLRRKLGDPPVLETVPGAGYRI